MNTRKTQFIFIFILLSIIVIAQNKKIPDFEIINSVDQIFLTSVLISFQNTLEVNNKGGHLQGIQFYKYNQSEYYFATGSSNTYSYYAVLKIDDENAVLSINNILYKPFKHAGGFQIYNNLMAVGVEDNGEMDKSKVFIYRIENPEKSILKPIAIIERYGEKKRATAGCVGIIEVAEYVIVIVGDWDTEHLDFYKIKKEKIGLDSEAFELVYSIAIDNLDKSEWINNSWLPYQNINFIKDESDNIYLAGMASNDDDKNVLDIFSVETKNLATFNLRKIHTKRFLQSEDSKFGWGAGVYASDDNKLKIISCGSHIQEVTRINI